MTAHIDFASLPDAEAARLMAEMDGLSPRPYTTSIDAAVGWLGRMGFIWQRKAERHDKYWVDVFWGAGAVHCEESDTCPTARALCNAGWAAVQARLNAEDGA